MVVGSLQADALCSCDLKQLPSLISFLALISGQLGELNWLIEGYMKNTRTGLRRAGAACVERGESRGENGRGKRKVERSYSQSFKDSKQLDPV